MRRHWWRRLASPQAAPLAHQEPPADLQVRADPAARYRHVAAVLAQAQRSGVTRLAVVDIGG